jgi:uncharacterized protein YprB with RNaseH-like and TPR domain
VTNDLRDKLRQLGVTKGAVKVQAPPIHSRRPRPIEELVDGQEVESAQGRAFMAQSSYPLHHRHGHTALASLVQQPAAIAAQLAREPRLSEADLGRAVFLDTETTGLSGGTGTLAFLVGIGAFEDEAFHLRQFFLRDPDEEAAMLSALSEWMSDYQAIVTFNGRGFDLPLLEARYVLARMRPRWMGLPHLDLLSPSRRVWRDRLPSCALSSLEAHVLGVERTQDDVPGFLIPQMYLDYLRTGDARDMLRVMYHNRQDILSMVTLATQLCRIFGSLSADESLDPTDLISLGKWYEDLGMSAEAESAFRSALELDLLPTLRAIALTRLGLLLKRQERREEARLIWEQLAGCDSVTGHIELAKHYEWHTGDLEQALTWTQAALKVVAAWPPGFERDEASAELAHRLERLERKRERSGR